MGLTRKNKPSEGSYKDSKEVNKKKGRRAKQKYSTISYNSQEDDLDDLEDYFDQDDLGFEKFSKHNERFTKP